MIYSFNKIINPLYLVQLSFFILFLQTQINFYYFGFDQIKIFELYNLLLIFLSPLFFNRNINKINSYLFFYLIFIIFYCNLILSLKYLGILTSINELNLFDYDIWKWTSVYNYISFLSLAAFVLILKFKESQILFKLTYLISCIVIIEVFIYFILDFFGFGYLWIDKTSGGKFYSLLILDSSSTGLILLLGFIYYVIFVTKNALNIKFLIGLLIFFIAIYLTKERYVLLTLFVFTFFFILKNIEKKYLVYFFIILAVISVSLLLPKLKIQNSEKDLLNNNFSTIDDKVNDNIIYSKPDSGKNSPLSIKSSLHRLTLLIRSYEITKFFFPYGTGPGSYLLFMYNDDIEFKIFEQFKYNDKLNFFLSDYLKNEIHVFHSKTGARKTCENQPACGYVNGKAVWTISVHNILAELINSLGFIGIIFSATLIYIIIAKFLSFLISGQSEINTLKLASSVFFIPLNFDSAYSIYYIFLFILAMSNYKINLQND